MNECAFLLQYESWLADHIVSVLTLILAIIGGVFAMVQWCYANKTKRTEVLQQIIVQLRFDKEMSDTMRKIDYDQQWYGHSFHNSADATNNFEHQVDKLLSYMSYICYLKERGYIKKEFGALQYEIDRVCTSTATQSYLWNIYHFSKKQKTKCSFQHLIDYGIKQGIINKAEFYNEESKVCEKILNF